MRDKATVAALFLAGVVLVMLALIIDIVRQVTP